MGLFAEASSSSSFRQRSSQSQLVLSFCSQSEWAFLGLSSNHNSFGSFLVGGPYHNSYSHFLVCATLALCFLLTNASIYRTIVEFDEDDDSNPMGPPQKCRRGFQQEQHLRTCQQLMRRQIRQGRGGGSALEDDEFDFEDDIENPQRPKHTLQQCCNELRQEDPVCVCPTLKQAAKAVRLQGQHGPYQTRKIFQTAKHLPNVCRIPQVGVCPFRARPFVPPYY